MQLSEYKYKDFKFVGISQGGIYTSIAIPNLKLMFDTGIGSPNLVDIPKILLTHGHLDHASGLAYLISQKSLRKLPPAEVYVPSDIYEPIDEILKLWQKIEQYKSEYILYPVEHNKIYSIYGNYYFQAVKSYHRIPSNGYVILEKRKKLKEEYKNLPGHQIAELKKTNPEIIEEKFEPIITFSGDTQIEFVINHEIVQRSKILFLECTYICDKRPIQRARNWGHIHLDEIVHNAEYFKDIEKLYLIHFSPRYNKKEIKETLKQKLPEWLYKKTTPFLIKDNLYRDVLESIPINV